MPRLNVGDKVVVRASIQVGDEFRGFHINSQMRELAGQICTISRVYEDEMYSLEESHSNFKWAVEFFVPSSSQSVSQTQSRRKVKCRVCGEECSTSQIEQRGFKKIDSKSGNYFYLCNTCATITSIIAFLDVL